MSDIPLKPSSLISPAGAAAPEGMMLPGVHEIGRGVDVIDKPYATVDSLLLRLFAIEDRVHPDDSGEIADAYAACERLYGRRTWGFADVEPVIGGRSSLHVWSGETLTSVQKAVMGTVKAEGAYAGFSGQVSAMASSTSARSAAAYFCNIYGYYPGYRLRLRPRGNIRDLLKPDIRAALDEWSRGRLIADFFPTYGGYYLKNAVIGGLVNYTAIRNSQSTQSESEFTAAMQGSFEYGLSSGSGSASGSEKEKHEEFAAGADTTIFSQGGTSKMSFADPGSVTRWQESILDSPEFIDFEDLSDGGGCAPVWELAADAARQTEIREAFLEYAVARQTTYAFHDPDLVPLTAYADWNSYGLRRWYYAKDSDHRPRGSWWERKPATFHVYASARPGCHRFSCCRKKVSKSAGLLHKDEFYIHKIVKGKAPKGWEEYSHFFAPTQPLKATLDKWTPVQEYTRKEDGDYCGQHYNKKGASGVDYWRITGKDVFHAVVR